jgi:hypothetical protein
MSLDFRFIIPKPLVDLIPTEHHEGIVDVAREFVDAMGPPVGVDVIFFWSLCLNIWNARQIVRHTRLLSYGPGMGGTEKS